MILVRRGLYYLLVIVVCLGIAGAGVLGYVSIMTAGADTADHVRFVAERYLFIAIAAALLVFLVFLWVVIRSLRLDRELDKIIELNRFQDFSPEMSMKKLGPIGKKITALYYQLNTLNEKKSLKISAQSELVTFIVNNLDLPVAVTDVTGSILWISPSFSEKTGKGRTEAIGVKIDTVLAEISIQNVIFELGRVRTSLEKTSGKNLVSCYPVYNRVNELTYVAFVPGKKAVYSEAKGKEETGERQTRASRLQKAFGRLLSRRATGK